LIRIKDQRKRGTGLISVPRLFVIGICTFDVVLFSV
jgi:hypothetical protein